MQSVIHEYANLSSVFTDMEFIYTDVSSSYTPGLRLLPLVFDTSFIDLYEILRDNVSWCPQYVIKEKAIPHINVPESNNMIVCISGGKDSVAVTKHYIDMGYNVYLYHMHGINKVYTDEIEAVKNVAKYFDVPLYVDTVVLSGTQDFVEHPFKYLNTVVELRGMEKHNEDHTLRHFYFKGFRDDKDPTECTIESIFGG